MTTTPTYLNQPDPDCDECDGIGWVQDPDDVGYVLGNDIPCTCTLGPIRPRTPLPSEGWDEDQIDEEWGPR